MTQNISKICLNKPSIPASEKLVSIRKITLGKWDANTYDNDIALLELEDLLFLNRRIKPICLPSQGEQFPLSSQCFVAGWGRLSDGGDVAKVLMAAKVSDIFQ